MKDGIAAGPTYEEVMTWADDVADGYDSRATANRYAIYGGALFAVAAAGTMAGLAIFSPGSAALQGLPLGATFVSGTMGFYNNDSRADLYDRGSKYVRRLIVQSRSRMNRAEREADSKNFDPDERQRFLRSFHRTEAICVQWDVQNVMRKVGRHMILMNPTKVVDALNLVNASDPYSYRTVNELLRSARRDFNDLALPENPDEPVTSFCRPYAYYPGATLFGPVRPVVAMLSLVTVLGLGILHVAGRRHDRSARKEPRGSEELR